MVPWRSSSILPAAVFISALLWERTSLADTEADVLALLAAGDEAKAAGNWDAACGKFREAASLSLGAGVLQRKITCDERDGRFVEAVESVRRILALLEPESPRRTDFETLLGALVAKTVVLEIELTKDDAAVVTVRLDGATVAPGTRLSINPGKHKVVVEAEGRMPAPFEFEVAPGETKRLPVSLGPAITAAPEAQEVDTAPLVSVKPIRNVEPQPGGGSHPLLIAGIATGGVGALGLVGFAITGGMILSADADAAAACPPREVCSQAGIDAVERGSALLLPNNVLLGVGLGLVAVGGALIVIDLATAEEGAPSPSVAVLTGWSSVGAVVNLPF